MARPTLAADFLQFILSSVVRDFGVILDKELTFAPHLNSLSRACYYQLRQLGLSTVVSSALLLRTSHAYTPVPTKIGPQAVCLIAADSHACDR